ncbi:hypothetical protein RHMOL_Rhmol07G0299900 [Rhododendron molle]|uniref:Uncharacterized protein n=1 Tax=Rhododendron molle TaxID=49168 RepID=A0ACC0N848_RHOML|nr:hypothetical protein RHMOL_Rhmol07G0299900 [Rhododendron molle]
MATKHRVSLLVVSLAIFFPGSSVSARDTVFNLKNLCSYTIWPSIFVKKGSVLGGVGFSLAPGASNQLIAPPGWSGRFWAQTGCSFDASNNGKCTTGDCGGKLMCTNSGLPPVTLAEFTIGSGTEDFYDVSLVDGYGCTMWA